MSRPGPLRWVWYAYGGTLPPRYREWVRYDTTSRNWLLRHAIRIVVKALPFLVAAFLLLLFLTPLPWWAAIVAPLFGLAFGLFYTIGSAREFTEVRLQKHGFPPGTGKR